MKSLFSALRKPNGAIGLGKVLIFLFGLEILAIVPYITLFLGFEFWQFLVFFGVLFLLVVYSKSVDAKIDGRAVSLSVKNEVKNNE